VCAAELFRQQPNLAVVLAVNIGQELATLDPDDFGPDDFRPDPDLIF
jgi:hypothetical protein